METKVEYNSKLVPGDKVIFYLDDEKFVGEVVSIFGRCWLNFWNEEQDHLEVVSKIFSHFEIPDKYAFRNQIIGSEWEEKGIWPCTRSLEELKKMLDNL